MLFLMLYTLCTTNLRYNGRLSLSLKQLLNIAAGLSRSLQVLQYSSLKINILQ